MDLRLNELKAASPVCAVRNYVTTLGLKKNWNDGATGPRKSLTIASAVSIQYNGVMDVPMPAESVAR